MTEIEVTESTLIVHIKRGDKIWALKSRASDPICPCCRCRDRSNRRGATALLESGKVDRVSNGDLGDEHDRSDQG